MVEYFSETDFNFERQEETSAWIERVVAEKDHALGEVSIIFCSDEYLYELNNKFLDHDTYTDIISFDYSLGKEIHGEIYISTDRVAENAALFNVTFRDELDRVMIHGILHFCGLKDKSKAEEKAMRAAEEKALLMRHNL